MSISSDASLDLDSHFWRGVESMIVRHDDKAIQIELASEMHSIPQNFYRWPVHPCDTSMIQSNQGSGSWEKNGKETLVAKLNANI